MNQHDDNIQQHDQSTTVHEEIKRGGPMLLALANQARIRLPAELVGSLSTDGLAWTAAVKTAVSQALTEMAPDFPWAVDQEWAAMVTALLHHLLEPKCPFPARLTRSLGLAVLADHLTLDWNYPAIAKAVLRSEFEAFMTGIRPRSLGRVAHNRTVYLERLKNYAVRRSATDEQVRSEVMRIANGGLDHAKERFFKKTPLARIRTYTDCMIDDVVRNFLDWDPVIGFLEAGEGAVQNVAFGELQRRTVNVLSYRGLSRDDAEDGVQAAIAVCLEGIPDPWRGYIYESPLPAWLINTALNLARNMAPGELPIEMDPDEFCTQVLDPGESVEQEILDWEALLQWNERASFVFSTYRDDKVQQRVRFMLLAGVREEPWSDQELAEHIRETTRTNCTEGLVRLTRMVFRARMEVFRYLDSETDEEMVAWIRRKWGVREADVPTLKKIGASARAAREEGTLGWALIASAVFENEAFGRSWIPIARQWLGQRDWGQHEQRYERWIAADKARAAPAVNLATTNGTRWAVPACWHLTVLRELTPEEVAQVLRNQACVSIASQLKGPYGQA